MAKRNYLKNGDRRTNFKHPPAGQAPHSVKHSPKANTVHRITGEVAVGTLRTLQNVAARRMSLSRIKRRRNVCWKARVGRESQRTKTSEFSHEE